MTEEYQHPPKDRFRSPGKHWGPRPICLASVSQFKEYQLEAQRLRELREKHEEWVQWTKGGDP